MNAFDPNVHRAKVRLIRILAVGPASCHHLLIARRLLFMAWMTCPWATISTAQNPTADSLMVEMGRVEGDSARIDVMNRIIYEVPTLTPEQRITYTKAILDLSKKRGDHVLESVTTAELGYLLVFSGNSLLGTELAYTALDMARHHDNAQALGIIYIALAACIEDSSKRIGYLRAGLAASERAGDPYTGSSALLNLSNFFMNKGVRDSALYYAQRCYERALEVKTNRWFPTAGLWILAVIHEDMYGDRVIAREYLKKALAVPGVMEHPIAYMRLYMTMSKFQLTDGRADSALHYADLLRDRKDMLGPGEVVELYGLYKQVYDTTNADSALKYYRLAEKAQAALEVTRDRQQVALLQMKKEMELDHQLATRSRNIQFGIIALIVITLGIFLLIFSRTAVVGAKAIKNLSLIALLLFFEFINLLVHPFLGELTHHSPILMLLCMAAIAGLLIPL
ncbi:MAG: hypothetical protein EHM43_12015, partial [Ignavibacteriae bacterium]